jgi:hypothetical protein
MGNWITGQITGVIEWLWAWIQLLAYWCAALGGTTSLILFFATHEKKFKTAVIVLAVGYVLIAAAGSVI